MAATLGELARRFECELVGDPEIGVERVATLASADGSSLTFLANPLYRDALAGTRAAAVVLDADAREACPVAALVTANPYAVYARIAAWLHPPPPSAPGVHATASVAADTAIAASAEIGPQAVVGAGSRVGDAAVIGAGAVVGAHCVVGAGTRLAPRAVVLDRVTLGARCIVHSGAVIGADGFGFARDGAHWIKVPQLGGVEIGDDVEVGANTTIDRGAIDNTVVENGVKLDNLIQIAHNVHIGEHTIMAAMSGAAGSTRIGRRCMIGGGAVIVGHLEICDDVTLLFRSNVTKSITEPGTWSGGLPAEEAGHWRRNAARFRQLDSIASRLKALEAKLRNRAQMPDTKEREND